MSFQKQRGNELFGNLFRDLSSFSMFLRFFVERVRPIFSNAPTLVIPVEITYDVRFHRIFIGVKRTGRFEARISYELGFTMHFSRSSRRLVHTKGIETLLLRAPMGATFKADIAERSTYLLATTRRNA